MIYIDDKVRIRARLLGKTLTVGYFPAAVAEQVRTAIEPEIRAIEEQALEAFREAVNNLIKQN